MAIFDGNVIRTTVEMEIDGANIVQNVFHWLYTGTTVIDDQVAVDDMRDHIQSGGFAILDIDITTRITFVGYSNFNLSLGAPLPFSPAVNPLAGLDVGESLPFQVAALLSFPTGVSRSIGRKYIAGYCESSTDGGGNILGAPLGLLAGTAAVWILTPVVEFGTGKFGNTDPAGLSFVPWSSFRLDTLFRTQRRRIPGVGA